jgi:hypothetical protein
MGKRSFRQCVPFRLLHPSEVGKGKDLDSIQEILDLVDDRTMPIPGTVTNQEKSPLVLPETMTVEDSNIVLGYGELSLVTILWIRLFRL